MCVRTSASLTNTRFIRSRYYELLSEFLTDIGHIASRNVVIGDDAEHGERGSNRALERE